MCPTKQGGRYLKKILKSLDYMIIIISLALFVIGIIALYSANGGVNGDTSEVTKQLVWFRRRYNRNDSSIIHRLRLAWQTVDTNIYINSNSVSSSIIHKTN